MLERLNMAKTKKTDENENTDSADNSSVVIINHSHSRKSVPYGDTAEGKGGRIGKPGAVAGIATLHMIHPGINAPISADLFKKITSNPRLKQWLEEQTLTVLDSPIDRINPDTCASLLARSSDVDGLKFWLKHETRKKWIAELRDVITEMDEHAEKTGRKREEDN